MNKSIFQATADLTGRPFVDGAAEALIILVLITATIYPALNLEGGSFNIGSYSVSALTFLMPIVAIGGAVYIFINRSEIHFSVTDLAVLVFMGYLLIRNSYSPGAPAALKYAVYCFSIYFIVSLIIQKPSSLNRLMYTIVCIALVMAVYGLIEYYVQRNYLYNPVEKYIFDSPKGVHRIGSSLGHPVDYAAFILQVIPFIIFSIYMWVRRSGRRQVALGVIAAALSVVALFLTYTMGSWIVAIVIFLIAAMYLWKNRGKKGLIIALGIIIPIALLIAAFWSQILNELSWRSMNSVNTRVIGWKAALEIIRDNLLIGTGLRQGLQAIRAMVHWNICFDNYYLEITSEGGIVALTLWLSMMGLIIKDGLKTIREHAAGRYLALAALVSMLAISLNGITFDGMIMWTHFIFFWFAAGILRGASLMQVSDINPASSS